MTEFSKKLFLNDLDPALPPENGETNLYQTTTGYLVSHGPAGVLLEAADGFSLETTPDGVQEVTMTAGCELIFSDTAVIVGDEQW
ncbi:hypothetical protein [Collimonas humicola]|uniref:hypothetical protein n=1 Tax=Collimonas humicola TaxID=2825886 RepID=UPI001B8B7DB6|nr:hypothetical protein [Collimonas humicola]